MGQRRFSDPIRWTMISCNPNLIFKGLGPGSVPEEAAYEKTSDAEILSLRYAYTPSYTGLLLP